MQEIPIEKSRNPYDWVTSMWGPPIGGMNITVLQNNDDDSDSCDLISKYNAIHMVGCCRNLGKQTIQTNLGTLATNLDNEKIFGAFGENEVQLFGFTLNGAKIAHDSLEPEIKHESLKTKLEKHFDNKIGKLQTGNDCGFDNGTFLRTPIALTESSNGAGISVASNEIVAICSGWNQDTTAGVICKSEIIMDALKALHITK